MKMNPPEQDVEDRTPIWDCMQDLYMDTDVTLSYNFIAQKCADSKYSIEELERILFNEVLPALRFNMFDLPAPEWAGFPIDWVVKRVLSKHRFGKRKPWILRSYTQIHWHEVRQLIQETRQRNAEK
ncbi:DUF7079 family protein [Undibacterium danionis]|uniref:DUF7079 domain-containing protein n=1 Tax=Undibacterium danionis TaxID=1812100 RepID=A0ABV6IFW1_9BURK